MRARTVKTHTLNICHALVKNLLENLGVFQILLDLGNDRLCELTLLPLLDALLVADPRIQNSLSLGNESSLLL
jgi:hypothetical protein